MTRGLPSPRRLPATLPAIAAVALAAGLGACSINVQDDRRHHGGTFCSVECPDRQQASVSCAAGRVPQCACGPAPAATCAEARAPQL